MLKNLAMQQKIILLLVLWLTVLSGLAQGVAELTENTPYKSNGLEYGWYVTNERSKAVKGDDYERYEVVLYVNNNSGCIKLFPIRNAGNTNGDEVLVADFTVKNATGKRLTSKAGKVNAQPWFTLVKMSDGKTTNAQVGYAIRNGQSLTSRIIVIVPKGERPKVNCRMVFIPEVN